MMRKSKLKLNTTEKALQLNLDENIYGTIAEIGGGQLYLECRCNVNGDFCHAIRKVHVGGIISGAKAKVKTGLVGGLFDVEQVRLAGS